MGKKLPHSLRTTGKPESKKASLPLKLKDIDPNLPTLFSAAVDSYEKSKSQIVGLDNAAMRIRDLIQQLWGALAAKTQQNCGAQLSVKRLEIKKQAHREVVARCLASSNNAKELLIILDQLFQLTSELSKPAKDPMFNDHNRLDGFFSQVILQIDALFVWTKL